jgi:hypothetical protein
MVPRNLVDGSTGSFPFDPFAPLVLWAPVSPVSHLSRAAMLGGRGDAASFRKVLRLDLHDERRHVAMDVDSVSD